MAKREPAEYKAKLTSDSGVLRGKIPSPLVKELGGRPGDFLVFNSSGGKITVSLSRSKGGAKKGAKGGRRK